MAAEESMRDIVWCLRVMNSSAFVELLELHGSVTELLRRLEQLAGATAELVAASSRVVLYNGDANTERLRFVQEQAANVNTSATRIHSACRELAEGIRGWEIVG